MNKMTKDLIINSVLKETDSKLKAAVDLSIDKYTGYEKLKQTFNHNNVRIGASYDVDQGGDDFEGFYAEIEGILTNGLEFSYSHDQKGQGEFKIRTRKRTEFYKTNFNLQKIGSGYAEVLESFLKTILDFNF